MKLLRFVLQVYNLSKIRTYRSYHTVNTNTRHLITEVKDLNIPMPYGKLAAKAWGYESGFPILALPGHQGNCGHFDKLIPLLTNQFYIVAIDPPGLGLSSPRPSGCLYTDMHECLDYRRVIDFVGWKKFHILGFCLGGCIGCLFSCIFPNLVEKIVVIDRIKPISYPLSSIPKKSSEHFKNYLEFEKELLKSPEVYTVEKQISKARKEIDALSLETIELVRMRNTQSFDCCNTFIYTRDERSRSVPFINLKSHELLYRYLSGVKSEILMIMSKNGYNIFKTDDIDVDKCYDIYTKILKIFY